MGAPGSLEIRRVFRLAVIALLAAVYVAMGISFHAVLHTDVAWSHFAYVPIVLAAVWWGRRGIAVALLLALVTVPLHVYWSEQGELWSAVVRILLFLAVSFCAATLSERLVAEQAARRASEEDYRMLTDKSTVGILVCRDGRVVLANPRFLQMTGHSESDLSGKPIWDLLHEQDRPRARDLVEGGRSGGLGDTHCECRIRRRDGTTIWADIGMSGLSYGGRDSLLVNVYDVTAMKEAEAKRGELADLARRQEEQLVHSTRLAELGEMAAAIAHELNQPLTGIRNYAKNAAFMIENGAGTPEEVKENLTQISAQVDRAARIINQMRELTRRQERQFAAVDVNGIVRESVEFLMPQFRLAGVEVSLDLDRGLPNVMGDRIRLEQVFLNLLTNARQAMEEVEERKLTVKTWPEDLGATTVAIQIADTGKGFAGEEHAKFFTPFYSTKKPGQGTGLGLSISLRIVRDHGGGISAVGAPGRGAAFTVRLPVRPKVEPQEASSRNG